MKTQHEASSNSGSIEKLHSETARISWHELQRFFAQGVLFKVDDRLDLVEIAAAFADDDANMLKPLIESKEVAPPSMEQARCWYDNQASLWSVVVAPFVLVQEHRKSN